jgi:hypothetical protein
MSEKKKLKTLMFKRGSIWVDTDIEDYNVQNVSFFNPSGFEQDIDELLRKKIATIRGLARSSNVTMEDFEKLKERVSVLEEKVEEIDVCSPKEIEVATKDALFQLAKLDGVEKIDDFSENKKLYLLVSLKDFSADLLRRIAAVEINLSQKYSDFSVEIKPILNT